MDTPALGETIIRATKGTHMGTAAEARVRRQVLLANKGQLDSLVEILADAFHDDPVMQWISPNSAPRVYQHFAFNTVLPAYLDHCFSYQTSDDTGAAVWLPPGISVPAAPINLKLALENFKFGFGSIVRGLKALHKMQQNHPKEPHYYLFALGARSAAQGQGVGTALIREVLMRADQEGIPAYLENSKEKNIPFYEGHGFKIIRELKLGKNAPSLWLMWREPH